MNLATAVRMFPTLNARDWKDTGDLSNVPENSLLPRVVQRLEREKLRNSPEESACLSGQLNPMWGDWFMGFRIGWTALEPLETR